MTHFVLFEIHSVELYWDSLEEVTNSKKIIMKYVF